jgi:hypothetical protein
MFKYFFLPSIILLAGSAILLFFINIWIINIERNSCYAFSVASNRETKFVMYNSVMGDCLTPSSDGKWISAALLREITN